MSSEELHNLLEWAKSNDAFIHEKIGFEYREGHGVSCVIKESLEESEREGLIKVPKQMIITPELADEFAALELAEMKESSNNVNRNLIFFLAKMKFDKSTEGYEKFKPYVEYLPKNGKTTGNPYFWTMEEKELLEGTDAAVFMKRNFLRDLEDWKKAVSQLDISKYPQLKDELLEYEAFRMGPVGGVAVDYLLNKKEISWTSFTAYLWASCIISSRAFPYMLWVERDSKYKEHAFMLPIVDLLNSEDNNESKCLWTVEKGSFVFTTLDDVSKLEKGAELYNNYGEKSNVEFLLNYGFCMKDNSKDVATLTLKIDSEVIKGAKTYGVTIPEDSTEDSLNYVLKRGQPIPFDLINLFAYLVKLKSERKGFTLRMKLEGLAQLKAIIKSKLRTLKNITVIESSSVSSVNAKTIKTYRKSQKDIFQQTLDDIEKLEKHLLTKFKPFSFKKAISKDTRFMNAFLVVFGTRTYADLIEKGLLDHAVMLWIMRVANKESYTPEELPDSSVLPNFVYQQFEAVKSSVVIDETDISEYLPMYETLFPALCEKVPSVFGRGNWTLNYLIYAATVADRLTYKRESSGEVFFIDPIVNSN